MVTSALMPIASVLMIGNSVNFLLSTTLLSRTHGEIDGRN